MNRQITRMLRFTALLLLAVVLAGLLALPAQRAAAQTPTATITAPVLNVRSGPSPGYPVVTTVTKGTVVTLLARDSASSWVRVKLANGTTGWITTFYITASVPVATLPVEAQAEAWAFVARVANLRSGPGLTYSVILTLAPNEPIGLVARNADASWVQARVRGGTLGWVASDLIVPGSDLFGLPLAAGLPAPGTPGVPAGPGLPLAPSAAGTGTINTGTTSTHTAAGKQHGIVAWINQNETVKLLGRNADSSWVYILFRDKALAWIEVVWVNTAVSIPTLPVVDDLKAPVGEDALQWLSGYTGGVVPATPSGNATVVAPALSVRTGPNTSYPLVTTVLKGTSLTLLGRNEAASWVYVSTPTGALGWVASGSISSAVIFNTLPLAAYSAIDTFGTATVTAPALNVRTGPGYSFSVLTTVQKDARLALMARDATSTWFKVRLPNGAIGWVGSGGVSIDIPLTVLPVMAQ